MSVQGSVLLLNDTDEGGTHFGCLRVMRTIREELSRRGMQDLQSIKVGTNWRKQPELVARIDAARLVVINGEGTLHHGKRRGRWLLEAGARVKANGGRVALINALWQENPADWGDLVREFDLLSCRDSRSAKDLESLTGKQVTPIGDLSMFHPWAGNREPREGTIVGCSVHGKMTKALAGFAEDIGAELVPVTTEMKSVPTRLDGWQGWLRKKKVEWQNHRFAARYPSLRFVQDDLAYLSALSRRRVLVTGRFHAVCLAVLSRTPFVAVASNSWKIEALISDIGLNPSRMLPLDQIRSRSFDQEDWSFTGAELEAIDRSLARWRSDGKEMFDRIAGLIEPTSRSGP